MLKTTVGRLLVNEGLPEDMRDYGRVLDGKGIKALFQALAERHPEKYRDAARHLADVGRDAAFTGGSMSFGLTHLRRPRAAVERAEALRRRLRAVLADPALDDRTRGDEIVRAVGREIDPMEKAVLEAARAENNPLATQVLSGARGNPTNLRTLLGGDLLYVDHHDRPIPIPVLRSYSQGLTPAEYFAGSFGARKGVVSLKLATADAGYAAKQMVQVAHRLMVSATDAETPPEGVRGLPVDTDDPDNEGALLAADAGPYKRNTVLTPRVLADLRDRGVARLLVRSPTVGGPSDGGVYARDVGVRERGGLAPIGDQVGVAAAQALSEPVTQMSIGAKHGGGVAKANLGPTGFKLVNQLIQVPRQFVGGAAHAQLDGRVQAVEAAPAGGHFVTVGGQRHYVATGHAVTVKPGDEVEAGDVLSDGLPNPAEIVRHKGIGEGRRYFATAFRDALKNSGTFGHRRNVELLARGLINHVELTEEHGDNVPGDVVPYSTLEHGWRPRPGYEQVEPARAVGRYLERPALHHTVGTRVTPKVAAQLREFKVPAVAVHADPPPFRPVMVRAMESVTHDPDWMTRLLGGSQQKTLLRGAHRGDVSDEDGTSFVPPLARGGPDLGVKGKLRDWRETPKELFAD